MSSSAPNTQGQITIAEGAKDVGARIIDADVAALEAGCAVGGFSTLPTAGATLRTGARRLDGRRDLALRQGAHRPGVDLDINASGLNLHQRPGVADVAGDGAKCPAASRDGVAVQPPRAAQGDGEAATIVVCHGRRSLLNAASVAKDDAEAALLVHFAQGIQLVAFADQVGVLGGDDELADKCALNVGAVAFGKTVEGEDYGLGGGGFGHGHFQLLPLISRGAEGKQSASHELNYTHETKERKNFLHLFFGGRGNLAKPSNDQASGARSVPLDAPVGRKEKS